MIIAGGCKKYRGRILIQSYDSFESVGALLVKTALVQAVTIPVGIQFTLKFSYIILGMNSAFMDAHAK